MATYWRFVNQVIQNSDILLLLLEARLIDETRHTEIEKKVKDLGKPLIYVITKSDLVDKSLLDKKKRGLKPCVFVSAKEYHGTKFLREAILEEAIKLKKDKVVVGVLGYPNVGKSSLINAMRGKNVAATSPLSGHTKGVKKIKTDHGIIMLDTPGVIPYDDDAEKHILISSVDYGKAKDPDIAVMKIMAIYPEKFERFYGVEVKDDLEETIADIARKRSFLKRGNELDIERAAREMLKDWQAGKIQ
jgi:ribosome biogenesis GTPase A